LTDCCISLEELKGSCSHSGGSMRSKCLN